MLTREAEYNTKKWITKRLRFCEKADKQILHVFITLSFSNRILIVNSLIGTLPPPSPLPSPPSTSKLKSRANFDIQLENARLYGSHLFRVNRNQERPSILVFLHFR